MAEHTTGWAGDERRSDGERRVAVMERADDRRRDERRRDPGPHRPDPFAALFEGIERQEPSQFIPPEEAEPRRGLAAVGARVAPPHDLHDAIPALAAIAGHPLHPMVVPIPIGAFARALAADLALAATGDRFYARAGRLLTGAGVVSGAVGGAIGAVDFVGRERVRSHGAAWLHAGGNAAALAIGAASLASRARRHDAAKSVLPVALAMSASAVALLLVTGWLGGELAYRHRIGVMEAGAAA